MAFPTGPTEGQKHNEYIYENGSWRIDIPSDTLKDLGGMDANYINWPGHDNRWVNTGIDVNAGSEGGSALIMASVNTSAGDSTNTALYLIRLGYDGNHYQAFYISGNSNFIDFRVSNSILQLRGVPGNNTARIIYYR